MTEGTRTFLVCRNVDCDERGSEAVFERFFDLLEDLEVENVDVREYLCFSACEHGPNVVCVEDRVWYKAVSEDDVAELVTKHGEQGEPVDRLRAQGEALIENLIFSTLDAGLLPGDVF